MSTTDLLQEDVISLAGVARLFPGARGAERVSPTTTFRWATKGVRTPAGVVKLETFRAGSRLFSTKQAVERFVTALSTPADPVATPTVRTPSARRKAGDAAAEALKAAGA